MRAGNGTRTRDPNLGKVVLYQLSYSREASRIVAESGSEPRAPNAVLLDYPTIRLPDWDPHGGEGNRTPDLVNAIHALSLLSYAPIILGGPLGTREQNRASYLAPLAASSKISTLCELRNGSGVLLLGVVTVESTVEALPSPSAYK